ncbi:MAG: c-type cytochrome [Dechloromonas sp.]|nr:c-type cytochrome [Dechloromonas sp.]
MKLPSSFPALTAFMFVAGVAASPVVTAADVPLVVPADSSIPAGPEGDAIRLGRQLMNNTRKQLPRNVGNGLNCSSCHIAGGMQANASPFVGLTALFPMYNARDGRVISLQTRINDCFDRSMNGHALAWDSNEMNAMLMYIRWLSTGVPVGSQVAGRGMGHVDASLKPDRTRGAKIYTAKCASCHGPQGAGTPDGSGGYVFPPIWGQQSYNTGAGMARTETAAAFIKSKMPMGQPDSLSDQDAIDVADFVAHQPRPVFAGSSRPARPRGAD